MLSGTGRNETDRKKEGNRGRRLTVGDNFLFAKLHHIKVTTYIVAPGFVCVGSTLKDDGTFTDAYGESLYGRKKAQHIHT
jgi:hypothetical protein